MATIHQRRRRERIRSVLRTTWRCFALCLPTALMIVGILLGLIWLGNV